MAKLLKPRGEVKKAIAARIRAGKDIAGKLTSLRAQEDMRTGSLSSLNGAKRQSPSSPHSMRKETSGRNSLLSRRQQSTHPRDSLFRTAKERWKQGSFGWIN